MVDVTILAIPGFLALVALEAWASRRRGLDTHEGSDSAASLAMGVGSLVVGAAWAGTQLAVYEGLHAHAIFQLGTGPAVFALAFLLDDFAYYWFHRLHHEVRLLWASHVPHHSSQRYNLTTALRQPWTPFTSLPFYAPLAWLGIAPWMLLTVHGVNLLYQFWIHTELIDRLGPLEAVLNTPSHHRVHHGANVQYLDRNYGGILIVWDRLFGTFEPEREPVRYGLTRNIETRNPLVIAFHEWWAVLRDALRPAAFDTWWRRLLAPPGWAPGDASHTAEELKRAALQPAAVR